jgi:hypothetical protein
VVEGLGFGYGLRFNSLECLFCDFGFEVKGLGV